MPTTSRLLKALTKLVTMIVFGCIGTLWGSVNDSCLMALTSSRHYIEGIRTLTNIVLRMC